MNNKKRAIRNASRMVWVADKYVQVPVPGKETEMKWIKVRVNGTYVRAVHGPIGTEAERLA